MEIEKLIPKDIKSTRLQSSEVATLDYCKLVVASKLLKKSVAAVLQTALYTYLAKNWEEHEKRLVAEATRLGVEPEELFVLLLTQELDSIKANE